MMRLATILAMTALAACLAACESQGTTPPTDCTADEACDDGIACTLDRCDPLSGRCVNTQKTCEDGNACTVDSCDAGTGECGHPALSCDDLNLCTEDTCDTTSGCINTAVQCPGDGNRCNVAACVPTTGACESTPRDCNDNNACTEDACNPASGDCTHTPVPDHTPCTIGPDFTTVSECSAGECIPVTTPIPGAFRITTMTLVSPEVTLDLGNGPEKMNDAISTFLTERLGEFEKGGMVALFDPLAFGTTNGTLSVGEGECPMGDGAPLWCGLRGDGHNATFGGVEQLLQGSCSDDPSVPAPCFKTTEASFDLHATLPDFFPNPVEAVVGRALGGLPGSPIRGIENGQALAFVPKSILEGLSIDLAGAPVTAASLLKDVPTVEKNGVIGWDIRIAFTAVRTASRPEDKPVDCNDRNPCTIDADSDPSGVCSHALVADGTACATATNPLAEAQCRSGACVEVVVPGTFRITAMTLVAPDVTFDAGNGPEKVNDAISAFLTERLGEFEKGGMVALFNPLHLGETASSVTFGEGDCPATETWCGLLEGGQNASFQNVEQLGAGACSDDSSVPAPCFKTPEAPFDLHAILPNWFPNPVDSVHGRVIGGLPGNPISGIDNGQAMAFVPKSILEGLTIDLAGTPVTGAALLKDVPTVEKDGVTGWNVRIAFTAVRTANRPVDCDDDNPCTVDADSEPSGQCSHTPVADGTACALVADTLANAECRAGVCTEIVIPGAFRISAMTLVTPEVTFDVGNGPEKVNDAISAYLNERLGQFEKGGMVAIFNPLHFGGTGSSVTFGEGECPAAETWCGLLEGGQSASFQNVEQIREGTCSDEPSVPAPCFRTPEVPFDLHAILPNWFPNPVDSVHGRVLGGLPGSPVTGIENGQAMAFVPKSILEGLSIDLAGAPVTGATLLKDVPTVEKNGVTGYDMRIAFTAARTGTRPAR